MDTKDDQAKTPREKLILAGIQIIEENGIKDFSIRKTAALCGVSCAAPYKHFRDKSDLLMGIICYVNDRWHEYQHKVLEEQENASTREKLIAVSRAYIRFLVENPHFRSIIMTKDDNMEDEYVRVKTGISSCTGRLITQYCIEADLSPERRRIKTFIVRSLIYGAALMFDNGQLEYTEENFELISQAIQREFDLA